MDKVKRYLYDPITRKAVEWVAGCSVAGPPDRCFFVIKETDYKRQLETKTKALEIAIEALEHYSLKEYVLSGQDYQMHGTSSARKAFIDNGTKARQALTKIKGGAKHD